MEYFQLQSFLIHLCVLFGIAFSAPSQPRMNRRSTDLSSVTPEVVMVNPEMYPVQDFVPEDQCTKNPRNRLAMTLHKFHGQNAPKCMDGTSASFYLLKRDESKDWVIYLPGGSFCADAKSCEKRHTHLTSSKFLNHCKDGMGILSTNERNNPHLHKSNMVYIPYCSSDLWSGTAKNVDLTGKNKTQTHFMGSKIIHHTIRLLTRKYGLRSANRVYLAGASAGGIGVLVNIDRIQRYLESEQSTAIVRGIVDSAWYLLPRETTRCRVDGQCSMVALLKQGANFWRPRVHDVCESHHKEQTGDRWKCFFGPVVHKFIQTPVFVIQSIFDMTQMQSDGIGIFGDSRSSNLHARYIQNLHASMTHSLRDLDGVFAPSCISHSFIHDDMWRSTTIDYVDISDAIQCWAMKLDALADEELSPTSSEQEIKPDDEDDWLNDEGDNSTWNNTSSYDDDEYYYDGDYDSSVYFTANRRPTCKSDYIQSCSIPQCSPQCPTLRYNYQTIPPEQLHQILFPNARNVCKIVCNL